MHPEDLSFKFNVGYNPEFELKGLDQSDVYDRFVVEPDEAEIGGEILSARKKVGELGEANAEEVIEDDDVPKLDAKEVSGETAAQFSVAMRYLNDEIKSIFA